mgnify:CR=1 FL=1
MEFNEIINKVNGSSNMKTPNKFVASNSGGDMNDKLSRVNQHAGINNLPKPWGSPGPIVKSPNTNVGGGLTEGSGGSGSPSIANQGRNGDTEIRQVHGKPSHVNAYEAYMIDNYGSRGEDFAISTGSGTTNPKTGLKEYGWFTDSLQKYIWDPIKAIFPRGDTGWFSESDSNAVQAQKAVTEGFETSVADWEKRTEIGSLQQKELRDKRKLKLNQFWSEKFQQIDEMDTGSFADTGSAIQKKKYLTDKLSESRQQDESSFNYEEDLAYGNWLAGKQGELNTLAGTYAQDFGDEAVWYSSSLDEADFSSVEDASYIFEGTDYEVGS